LIRISKFLLLLGFLLLSGISLLVVGCGSSSSSGGVQQAAVLAAIQITPGGKAIAKGTTLQLSASGISSDGSSRDLTSLATWSTSNSALATVSSTGLVTGVTPGEVTISASFQGVTGSTLVTVTGATLSSVVVNPPSASIARGTNQQFRLVGTFSDNSTQDLTSSATWTVSPPTLASINDLGLATATTVGTGTVTGAFGGRSANANLTVTAATLRSITVTPSGPAVARGFSQQFTATGTFSDNSTQNLTTTVTWSSGDTAVATVGTNTGLATGVNVGNTQITATSGAVNGSTPLSVTAATLTSVAFSPAGPYNLVVGGANQQLTLIGTFSDASTLDLSSAATWGSDNTGVFTVTNTAPLKGTLSAVAAGDANVGATVLGVSTSAAVHVTGQVNRLILSSSDQILTFDRSANGNTAPLRNISGAATTLSNPQQIAVVGNEVFVANAGANNVLVFDKNATGNVAPLRTLGGASTGITIPVGIVVTGGELFVTASGSQAVRVFPAAASGNVAPSRSIQGANTLFVFPNHLSVTASELLVADPNGNQVLGFPLSASGNVAPGRVLAGASTGLNSPRAVATSATELFVNNNFDSTIRTFPLAATGNVAPTRVITSVGDNGNGLTLDLDELFVGITGTPDRLDVLQSSASGAAAPVRSLQGANTLFTASPRAVVIAPAL